MKVIVHATVYLYSSSLVESVRFYVDELGLFTVLENCGTGYCLLACKRLPGFRLYLSDWCGPAQKQYILSLEAEDCDAEFRRLSGVLFTSGARITPDETGQIGVLEYPGGKVFQIEDPDGNLFTIAEHYKGGDEI